MASLLLSVVNGRSCISTFASVLALKKQLFPTLGCPTNPMSMVMVVSFGYLKVFVNA